MSYDLDWRCFEAQRFPIFNMLIAAFSGHYNALVHLVTTREEIDYADKEKVISAAAMGRNSECLQYLLSQNYPANASFKTPEQIKNDLSISGDIFGEGTALHWAAIWGNREMAHVLIANGADRNAHNREGFKPITWTIRNSWNIRNDYCSFYLGRMSPSQEVRADRISKPSGCNESVWENSLMKLFVEKDTDLEDAISTHSLLYEAVLRDDENAVKFLLEDHLVEPDKGLSVSDDHYTETETPLHLALEKRSRRICMRLLKARADASILGNRYIRAYRGGDPLFLENVSALHMFSEHGVWDEELLIALL